MGPIITGIVSKITGQQAAGAITAIGSVIDNLSTSGEEKEAAKLQATQEINRHFEVVGNQSLQELNAYFADTANARDMNTRIQESDKASWLSKNIAYIIDCVTIGGFLCMLAMIAFRAVPESNKELFYSGFGVLGTLAVTSVNFHRGTSKSSEVKGEAINKMMAKNN